MVDSTQPSQYQWNTVTAPQPDYNISSWTYPYYWYPTQRTYKCPCGGEFFAPIQKKRLVNGDEQVYYVCPFCGVELKGMTD